MGLGRSFFTNCARAPTSAVSTANNTLMETWTPTNPQQTYADYGCNTFNPIFINRQQSTIGG
jgi:hypothetical protein